VLELGHASQADGVVDDGAVEGDDRHRVELLVADQCHRLTDIPYITIDVLDGSTWRKLAWLLRTLTHDVPRHFYRLVLGKQEFWSTTSNDV
jgi:hypothetical protein